MRIDDHDLVSLGETCHRREIGNGVVWQLFIQMLICRVRRIRGYENGIAVRGRFGDRLRADYSAGAGLVIHDDPLLRFARNFLRCNARKGIGRAAGCEGDDERNSFFRILRSDRNTCSENEYANP